MRITKLGHSCLHVIDGDGSILIDPGVYSAGFEALTGLTAILVTHQHVDHLDQNRLPALLAANPETTLYADPGSAPTLESAGFSVTTVRAGDEFDVGTSVSVHGSNHAVIHTDVPIVPNAAYLISGRFLHPGDSFTALETPVDVLALPAAAPWMALKEGVEYLREVAPQVAFPIHDRILADPAMTFGLLGTLGPEGTRWLTPADGESFEV